MMNNTMMMTAMPDEIVTKLIEVDAAIKRVNGIAPEALLFAKKGSKGCKASKGGRSPKRHKDDGKRDNEDDRKEKDFRKCFHWQQRGSTTENCIGKQRSDPPKAADTAANPSTETTLNLSTTFNNYWMVASSKASSSDLFIDGRCTTPISH
jgi:hypothetical protein